jgi:hypothetical protein
MFDRRAAGAALVPMSDADAKQKIRFTGSQIKFIAGTGCAEGWRRLARVGDFPIKIVFCGCEHRQPNRDIVVRERRCVSSGRHDTHHRLAIGIGIVQPRSKVLHLWFVWILDAVLCLDTERVFRGIMFSSVKLDANGL